MTPEDWVINIDMTLEVGKPLSLEESHWLFNRVKELTEALEHYAAIDTKIGVDELQCIARDALVGSKG